VQSLIAQLGWTHFLHIIRLADPLKRDFYAKMCRIERWSTRHPRVVLFDGDSPKETTEA